MGMDLRPWRGILFCRFVSSSSWCCHISVPGQYFFVFFGAPKNLFYWFDSTISGCDGGYRTRNKAVYTWRLSPLSYNGQYCPIYSKFWKNGRSDTSNLAPTLIALCRIRSWSHWRCAAPCALRRSRAYSPRLRSRPHLQRQCLKFTDFWNLLRFVYKQSKNHIVESTCIGEA